MSFLFSRSKSKSPPELVRSLSDVLSRQESSGTDSRKLADELGRLLLQIKITLYGDQETDPVPDQIALLAQEVYASDVLVPLVANLQLMEFDSRKDVVVIFTTLLRRQIGNRSPTVDYLQTRPTIFDTLITWSAKPELGITANAILRDCIKYDELARIIINSPLFWNYMDYLDSENFETASDAFTTVHELFASHPKIVSDFLRRYSGPFSNKMTLLMASQNYVTKRQSIKLLGAILRERANYGFMTEYISNTEHLKQVMNLLRDKSKNVQYESFQIFKVFVANPKKPKPIVDILAKNKRKLIQYLTNLNYDKKEDDVFKDEKDFIIKQINELPDVVPSKPGSPTRELSPQLGQPHLLNHNALSGNNPSILSPTLHLPPPVVHVNPIHAQSTPSPPASHASHQPSNFQHPLPKLPTQR